MNHRTPIDTLFTLFLNKKNIPGRLQADMTGRRLKEMGWNYQAIVHSTMIRAAQTAQIIGKHLAGVPMRQDELIREGGPIPPDPTITYFSLPNLVIQSFIFHKESVLFDRRQGCVIEYKLNIFLKEMASVVGRPYVYDYAKTGMNI